ncbi:MAG: hypothetical protein KC441_01550 [Anaerolineales bacterium]|nr:hypothetical protein [Anaerolineales bacterium]
MKFWVDIENAAGEKQNAGPIQTAVTWQQTTRLSRAGSFNFLMPAVDARSAAILPKRHARCWGMAPGLTQIGRGIIDDIKVSIPPAGEVMLTVSGDDLLRELTWRSVGQLQVAEPHDDVPALTAIRHDPTAKTNVDLVSGSLSIVNTHYIYIRGADPFSAWWPTLDIYNINNSTLSAQFYSDNEEWNGWETIAITDGTSVGGKTLAKSGAVTWSLPATWAETSHDSQRGYWMRFKVSTTTSTVRFTRNSLSAPGDTTNGPALVMAFAPPGWSLDGATGHSVSATAVKWQFNGETVLAALVKLAELTGENFRLGNGRSLVWLQTTKSKTHLRAVRHTAAYEMLNNDAVCLIVDFEEEHRSHDSHVGRIYPIGQDDITLAETTRSAPTGYALGSDALGHYLENTTAEAAYGIHIWLKVSGAKTADELFDAAYEELKKRKDATHTYRLTVTKVQQPIYVGDTITVEYRSIVGGYIAHDINDDFTVLEITDSNDQNGCRTVRMIISSVPHWPRTNAEELAKLL